MTTPSVGPPGTFPGFVDKDFPQDDLYKCVHCGFCLNACPTYIETGLEAESPRGRLALMKAVNEGRLDITPQVVGHWDLCLQCRACEVACPSGVPYGRLMEATRTSVEQSFNRPRSERIGRAIGYRGILTSPALTKAAGAALKLYMKTGIRKFARKSGILRLLPGDFEHLDDSLPSMSDQFFSAKGQVIRPRGVPRGKVALLAGCVMPLSHANTMEAATRVLAHNGVEVVVTSGQGCCGALNAHAGERESARAMARRNIDSFLSAEPDAIVTLSAGCGSTMKEYGELLHHDDKYAAKAERAASLTKDIHEYLVGLPLHAPENKSRTAGDLSRRLPSRQRAADHRSAAGTVAGHPRAGIGRAARVGNLLRFGRHLLDHTERDVAPARHEESQQRCFHRCGGRRDRQSGLRHAN